MTSCTVLHLLIYFSLDCADKQILRLYYFTYLNLPTQLPIHLASSPLAHLPTSAFFTTSHPPTLLLPACQLTYDLPVYPIFIQFCTSPSTHLPTHVSTLIHFHTYLPKLIYPPTHVSTFIHFHTYLPIPYLPTSTYLPAYLPTIIYFATYPSTYLSTHAFTFIHFVTLPTPIYLLTYSLVCIVAYMYHYN